MNKATQIKIAPPQYLRSVGRQTTKIIRTRGMKQGVDRRAAGTGTIAALSVLGCLWYARKSSAQTASVSPRLLISQGMKKFLSGDVKGSVVDFDQALQTDPSCAPRLWQRGLSLYYMGEYKEAAKQFRLDVAANPNDTEEALWTFLSEAQVVGADKAREQFLVVGRDPRPLLRLVYDVYQNAKDVNMLTEYAQKSRSAHDEFYSKLYCALWHESLQNSEEAKTFMLESINTSYAKQSGDYMCGLALVHSQVRGWI